jgi:hypothetical protein
LTGPVRHEEVEPSAIKYWVSSPPDLTNELAVIAPDVIAPDVTNELAVITPLAVIEPLAVIAPDVIAPDVIAPFTCNFDVGVDVPIPTILV